MTIPKIDCWKTRIFACQNHPFEKKGIDGQIILDLCHFESISCLKPLSKVITIEADPFLFINGERLFLFFESKNLGENGVIKQTSTVDLQNWTPPITVLKEDCHLSYPFVFEDAGNIYMIPETGALRCIRLYRATNDDLTDWEYCRTLVEEDDFTSGAELSFCDSSILKLDGIYYLFTTIVCDNTNELHLYYSNNMGSIFVKHPRNPLVKSNKYGRCAGSIIHYDGRLFRVSQECSKSYGENVCVSEIETLSLIDYTEKVLTDSFYHHSDPYYKFGAHQLNIAKFKDKYIVATDAKGYRKAIIQRLLDKMSKSIRK